MYVAVCNNLPYEVVWQISLLQAADVAIEHLQKYILKSRITFDVVKVQLCFLKNFPKTVMHFLDKKIRARKKVCIPPLSTYV